MIVEEIVYTCDPDSLGDITPDEFWRALDSKLEHLYPTANIVFIVKPTVNPVIVVMYDRSDPSEHAQRIREIASDIYNELSQTKGA